MLMLDEPTSAVDPQSRRDFWESLFALVARGTTILVSTHYMDEAERCHRLAILSQGRVVAEGEPEHLMTDLPLQVIEVQAADIDAARRELHRLPEVQKPRAAWACACTCSSTAASPTPRRACSEALTRAGIEAEVRGHARQPRRRVRRGDAA